MTELNHDPTIEQQADDIVTGWWQAQAASVEAADRYSEDILEDVVRNRGLLGLMVLERLAASEHVKPRETAAIYLALATTDSPKERYLALAKRLLVDDDPDVVRMMLQTLFDEPLRDDLLWSDLSRAVVQRVRYPTTNENVHDNGLLAQPPSTSSN